MNESSLYTKDAEQLINFFHDFPDKVEKECREGDLISFCLGVLNAKNFSVNEINLAVADLKSILLMIQRSVSEELAQELNTVVNVRVDSMCEWLKCVHDRILEPWDTGYLLGNTDEINAMKSQTNNKTLMNDYFNLITSDEVGFNSGVLTITEMEEDDALTSGADWLALIKLPEQEVGDDKTIVFAPNPVDILDRRVIWINRKSEFKKLLETKTRKKKHKQVVKALAYLYEQIGEELLYKNVGIETSVYEKSSFKYSKQDKGNIHFVLEGVDGS